MTDYQEVQGNGGGSFEEREFVSARIGVTFEGTFVDLGRLTEGQYGPYRVLAFDTEDGRKMACRASKILLERLEDAIEDERLTKGDKFKVVVESQKAKKSNNTYALPRLFVSRSGGQVNTPQRTAPAPVANSDEPPF